MSRRQSWMRWFQWSWPPGGVALSLVSFLLLAACGGRGLGAERGSDGSVPDGIAPPVDAVAPRDAVVPRDASVDPCGCPMDRPVYQWHPCVPPLEYGCEARLCTPGVTDCGAGYSCEECAAAACCVCAACVPACLFTGPAMEPLPDYLKIFPPYGPAHEEVTFSIEGYPFYVGALYYLARMGDSGDLYEHGGDTCAIHITAPARPPGMFPVWVSQYGGNEPWVLAGFFTFSSGDYPTCVQPGYPCDIDRPCCETPDVPMICQAGRCQLQ